MKTRAGVLFISILVSLSSMAQDKNPDAFLSRVVSTFKNNDTASFVNLFIDYRQLKSLLLEAELRDEDKDTANNAWVLKSIAQYSEKQYREDIVNGRIKKFSDFRSKIVNKGISPSDLIFDSSRYEESIPKRFDKQRLFKGTIFLTTGKDVCRIPFMATWLETQKGWMDIYLMDFLKKGEELPHRDMSGKDTVSVQLDEIEEMEESPPPPPPPAASKRKTTTKSPARKTKVKT